MRHIHTDKRHTKGALFLLPHFFALAMLLAHLRRPRPVETVAKTWREPLASGPSANPAHQPSDKKPPSTTEPGCWLMLCKNGGSGRRESKGSGNGNGGATADVEHMLWYGGEDFTLCLAVHDHWRKAARCDKNFAFRLAQFTGKTLFDS